MSDTLLMNEKTSDVFPLTLTRLSAPDTTTLVVTGEVDMTTYEAFCQALMDEADRTTQTALLLDLTGVGYIDARTWTLIVQVKRHLTSQGRSCTVALAPGGQPARVHELMRLAHVLPLA